MAHWTICVHLEARASDIKLFRVPHVSIKKCIVKFYFFFDVKLLHKWIFVTTTCATMDFSVQKHLLAWNVGQIDLKVTSSHQHQIKFRSNKMKIFAVTFFFIYFAVLINSTSDLPYGGGMLTSCGKYIPGIISFKSIISWPSLIFIEIFFHLNRFNSTCLGSNIWKIWKTCTPMHTWLRSDDVESYVRTQFRSITQWHNLFWVYIQS